MGLSWEWLPDILREWVADLLGWFVVVGGGAVMVWLRARYWRWVDPILYGLMTTACLYILLHGFRPHGVAFLDWLIPVVFLVVSIALLLVNERRERTVRNLPREDVTQQSSAVTSVATALHVPSLLEMNTYSGQWPLPLAGAVLQAVGRLKKAPRKGPVKIMAGAGRQTVADLLVQMFQDVSA